MIRTCTENIHLEVRCPPPLGGFFFAEATLPTSMLFAALCSQITQHRMRTRSRYAACRLLYDILKKLIGTGKMKVSFTTDDGRLYNITIPKSGLVNSPVVTSLMGAVSIPRVKQCWRKDAQDWYFIVKTNIRLYVACTSNFMIINTQLMD